MTLCTGRTKITHVTQKEVLYKNNHIQTNFILTALEMNPVFHEHIKIWILIALLYMNEFSKERWQQLMFQLGNNRHFYQATWAGDISLSSWQVECSWHSHSNFCHIKDFYPSSLLSLGRTIQNQWFNLLQQPWGCVSWGLSQLSRIKDFGQTTSSWTN